MIILYKNSGDFVKLAEKSLVDVAPYGFPNGKAIGVATGNTPLDRLYAISVYHDYNPIFKTCAISFVSFSPRWATKGNIKEILGIPFIVYGVKKLWAATTHDNEKCIKLLKGVGFTQEAVLRHHFGQNKHAVIFRLFEENYNKLYNKEKHGKNIKNKR